MKYSKNMHSGEGPVLKARQTSAKPAGPAGRGSDVGNERKADVHGVQEGGSRAEAGGSRKAEMTANPSHIGPGHSKLSHAKHELHSQHPHHHSDHGPHHGTDHHIRHEPMHGLHPGRHGKHPMGHK